MINIKNILSRDEGAALVVILMIVALLTLAGISAIDTSVTEVRTATNDMHHKVSFYVAEGALDVASELLEQNLYCPSGFTEDEDDPGGVTIGTTRVISLDFSKNESVVEPSDDDRDIFFPYDYGTGSHTNIKVYGSLVQAKMSAIQMAAGYEGKGKGMAGGGASKLYDIHAQHMGKSNSVSEVKIQWRHLIGQEEDCKY